MSTVGVLAIQGDFEAHERALEKAGVEAKQVLFAHELDEIDALVIPGGESTTISKGMDRLGLEQPIKDKVLAGMPVLGTCAGAILLSRETENHPVHGLGALDAVAVRNAYGTQVDSFTAPVDDNCPPEFAGMKCVFIRAPKLKALGSTVEVLASVDGEPVLVRQGNVMAATFHPEITDDARLHEWFVKLCV